MTKTKQTFAVLAMVGAAMSATGTAHADAPGPASNIEGTSPGWQGDPAATFTDVMAAFDKKSQELNDAASQQIADLLQTGK